MLAAYRPLFATVRARRLVAASLLGRAAIGMIDLPLILLAQDASGSYAVAGAALGAHAAGVAVSAPLRGRLVDRRGARSALPPFVLVTTATLAAMPLAATLGGWPVVALAALAGLSVPPLVVSMRLEWQRLLGIGDTRLEQAYAFEAAAQVALYIVGPLIAGLGIAAVGAGTTLAATGGLALAGGMAFAFQASGARRSPSARRGLLGPLRLPGLRTLLYSTALADTGLGAVDVAVAAFAQQRGEAGAAGILLAIFAASSVLGGTLYGARSWSSPPARRLALLTAVGALALLPLALANSLLALGCLLVLAGAPFTAQWAARSVTLDDVAPTDIAAEAYNWLSSANGAGIALGGLLAGVAIELAGTGAAFFAGAGVVALAAAVVTARARTLTVDGEARAGEHTG